MPRRHDGLTVALAIATGFVLGLFVGVVLLVEVYPCPVCPKCETREGGR